MLDELGFETPTDIQAQSIPQLISGHKDFIGLAQTGTGKTAAFGLPLLEQINPSDDSTQGLILAPTRELGRQIAEQLAIFSKYMDKVNVLPVYGGAAISGQIKDLRKPQHIIIATPGRLIDLIGRKAIKLGNLRFLVLDEADEMLNMGFKEDIDEILNYTPEDKLTWLFSATMPPQIKKIVNKYMVEPVEVKVNTQNKVNKNIEHLYTVVRNRDKSEALKRFLDMDSEMRGVVFCRTRRDTQELAELLLQHNYKADALHGDLSQAQRDRVMSRFKNKSLQVLIATDVAARGIDVNDLTHVFHFTLPDDEEYYTHRSGRTARAGKKGASISFISNKESYRINRLEKALDIDFIKLEIPSGEDIAKIRIENWCRGILETPANQTKVYDDIKDQAFMLFGNLTKEELIAKLVSSELKQFEQTTNDDLNASAGREERGGGGGRDRGGRNGGGGRGRGRDRGRGRSGGGGKSGGSGGGRDRRKSGGSSEAPSKRRNVSKKKKYFSK